MGVGAKNKLHRLCASIFVFLVFGFVSINISYCGKSP